ncbi:MAG TPA: helix-turn-helix domain-containing protein [Coriobacteriia bacterium]|nr:helix-turn-helix domain-containing protein [Coriobacteriia bacterium]
MSTPLDIGTALVRERRASGMSQRELAERLDTSQQQVARWEAVGYRTVSLERVAQVAEALGVSVALTGGGSLPLAAEEPSAYGRTAAGAVGVRPVRDLGEIAGRLREHYLELRDTYGFERIGVFGSFACGEQTPDSDVDLLVETAEGQALSWLGAGAAAFIEGVLGRKVDLVEAAAVRERIQSRVLREAIYVWEA